MRTRGGPPPGWDELEKLIAHLVQSHAVFPTAIARSNWLSSYEPGKRVMVESDGRSKWVQVEHIRECWQTFERRGRVERSDVLEPGRSSAFMMGLFEQLPGVEREKANGRFLVFAGH